MSDTECKLIAVMGATGFQGGAVVQAFANLGSDKFEIRAITRDPEKDSAKALEGKVREIVKADGDDEESMIKAFEGCHGAFIMSNFWEACDVRHEMKTLRTCKEAAKKAGVKHVVLSGLEDTRAAVKKAENKDTWKVLDEELGMYTPHFDGKGEVGEEYLLEVPTTLLFTSFYYENFINLGMGPSRQSDSGPYGITFPMGDKKLSMVKVEDIGKCACAIFQDESLIGKTIGVSSANMTCKDIAAVFSKVCGQEVVYNDVPVEVYASFPFPGADDLANMFRYKTEYEEEYVALRTVPESVISTMGGVADFEEWVKQNKECFILAK
eukprot:CAMPEP_0172387490 /NCGR_PEP_ID=MMETSP1061-20121228/4785_1 /TAXON_ID=37318 /ORGANISM="Pseudo-nitzschia pungens, Strain cf. pungens" /LENGTH=323 /DNA_ID=CAMNT_0013117141 /DNA_START=117 /DNA_END=1088 /DNA_ORIENTATION=+